MSSSTEKRGLQQWVREIEQHIIVLSGPLLATSGIIAGLDVVTNNFIAHNAPGIGAVLGLIWAVCLMMTLDFQVLVLGVRARRVYISNKGAGKKALEMALAFAIALALGYVSLQMGSIFSRMMGTSLSMEQAQAQLGINPIWLVYERSAMVMLLIFMSGWLRDEDEQVTVHTQPAPQAVSTISESDMHIVLAALDEVKTLRQRVAQLQAPTQPALPESVYSKQASDESSPQASDDIPIITSLKKPIKGLPNEQSYGTQIEALYKENPEITAVEIEERLGCSRVTAAKWLRRCRPAE